MFETDIEMVETIRAVVVELAAYLAEVDDVDGPFGETPLVGPIEGGFARRWFVVRHETDDQPAIRVTVEVES